MAPQLKRNLVFQMNPPKYSNLPPKFWDQVEVKPSGCWEWTGTKVKNYGRFTDAYTHRLSKFDEALTPITSVWVLHHCDNPPCVFPEHLYFGNAQDNSDDMYRRGRNNSNSGIQGERHHNSKLTDQNVLEVRASYEAGEGALLQLSKDYGVSESAIRDVLKRRTWKHV